MFGGLLDTVCGPLGLPNPDDDQIVAPWASHGCGSKQGFRRRGAQVRRRKLTSLVGTILLMSKMVECRSSSRRFSPLGQLLGLAPRQRRTPELTRATAALAVEVAYAKASRLLGEIGGVTGHQRMPDEREGVIKVTNSRLVLATGTRSEAWSRKSENGLANVAGRAHT